MNIREAAEHANLPVKTVRYYDEIGLVEPARAENGYRLYEENDIHTLKFLGRARGLGFSLDDCRQLLSLYQDQNRASSDVRQIAKSKIEEIDIKLTELQSMRSTLASLVEACHGDDRPDCPILDGLGG